MNPWYFEESRIKEKIIIWWRKPLYKIEELPDLPPYDFVKEELERVKSKCNK